MRKIVLATILLVLLTAVTAGIMVGDSSAATSGTAATSARPTCSKLSGTLMGSLTSISVSDCTGGLGTGDVTVNARNVSDLRGKVTWYKHEGKRSVSQGTTSIDKGQIVNRFPSRCPSAAEYDLTGTVSADTTHKIAVGSRVSVYACLTTPLTLVKGTVIKL